MNTGNISTYQWLMAQYPHLVTKYIYYNDATPFQPLQLQYTIKDLEKVESMHGKLTAIVRYWSCYKKNNKPALLSFGLDVNVAVNSTIIGIPTLRQWGVFLDLSENNFTARSLKNFPFITNQPLKECMVI